MKATISLAVSSVIETTVKQALAKGVAKGELPKEEKAQLTLVRMAFIPHLARVNPAGQFVRRVATRAEIPPEARPLIDGFVEARLLIKDRRRVGGESVEVVEVAHEALLREWKDLNDALIEEREFLVAKGQLEQELVSTKKLPRSERRAPCSQVTSWRVRASGSLAAHRISPQRNANSFKPAWMLKRPGTAGCG